MRRRLGRETIGAGGESDDDPALRELPTQHVAVLESFGDPAEVAPDVVPRLYAAVGAPAPLRARWPNAHLAPRNEWIGLWALPIADTVTELEGALVEDWEYGQVAEIVHEGPYETEQESVAKLLAFAAEQGLELVGPHEEEYLTPPGADPQRTLIRYRVSSLPR